MIYECILCGRIRNSKKIDYFDSFLFFASNSAINFAAAYLSASDIEEKYPCSTNSLSFSTIYGDMDTFTCTDFLPFFDSSLSSEELIRSSLYNLFTELYIFLPKELMTQ